MLETFVCIYKYPVLSCLITFGSFHEDICKEMVLTPRIVPSFACNEIIQSCKVSTY